MKHGAISDAHIDKMFQSPKKEEIVSAVIRAADYRTGLPENFAMKVLNDRSLIKHHRSAITDGLGGAGAEKYFKANAARPVPDSVGEKEYHINALISAGNHYSALGPEITSAYHKLPEQIKDRVISGIRHSTTEQLNEIKPENSTIGRHLADHKNSGDQVATNIKNSDLSPATKGSSLLAVLENRHNKLTGEGVHSIYNHFKEDDRNSSYTLNKAVAQHPATQDHTLRDIVTNARDLGYGPLSAISTHPNASKETLKLLDELHGKI